MVILPSGREPERAVVVVRSRTVTVTAACAFGIRRGEAYASAVLVTIRVAMREKAPLTLIQLRPRSSRRAALDAVLDEDAERGGARRAAIGGLPFAVGAEDPALDRHGI